MNKISPFFFAVCVAISSIACGSAIKPVATPDHNYDVRQVVAQNVGGITVFYKVPKAEQKPAAKKTPAIFGETVTQLPSKDDVLDCSVDVARPGSDEIVATFTTLPQAQEFASKEFGTFAHDSDNAYFVGYEVNLYRDPRCDEVTRQEIAAADSE